MNRGRARPAVLLSTITRLKPGFAAAVVVTLGLGIGANATMFGVVDRLLFRPPAYLIAPTRVHRVYFERAVEGKARSTSNVQFRRYLDIEHLTSAFDAVVGYYATSLAVGIGDDNA